MMKQIVPIIVLFHASLFVLWAQQRPLEATAGNEVSTLPRGTRMRVKFESTLRTNVARPGDVVDAALLKPVENNGAVVLPSGTHLRGQVKTARSANKKNKTEPNLLLAFNQVILRDGRVLHAQASIAEVGRKNHVDSTGLVSRPELTDAKKIAAVAINAGMGAAAGLAYGGKAIGIGAAAGAGYGGLVLLIRRSQRYSDFELPKGRKLWLRLNSDLTITNPDRNAK